MDSVITCCGVLAKLDGNAIEAFLGPKCSPGIKPINDLLFTT